MVTVMYRSVHIGQGPRYQQRCPCATGLLGRLLGGRESAFAARSKPPYRPVGIDK